MAFPPTGKWRFIVPNAVTCFSMSVGLLAITRSFEGRLDEAAWLILLSVLMDKLDGTMARLLNASTKIGVQLDSFSDFLTFGVAPGFLFYKLTQDPRYAAFWDNTTMGYIAQGASAFLVIMAMLRLARFNVMTDDIGGRIFLGIPTTLVGGLSASFVLTAWKYDLPPAVVAYFPFALFVLGLWMVSNLPLPKMRTTSSKAFNIFQATNALASYVLIIFRIYPEVPFLQSFLYMFIGTYYAHTHMRADWEEFRREGVKTWS
jgi:CDP-diacylglycerol--serine O-phosphatidyltransferase